MRKPKAGQAEHAELVAASQAMLYAYMYNNKVQQDWCDAVDRVFSDDASYPVQAARDIYKAAEVNYFAARRKWELTVRAFVKAVK
jgi:hypothetical protein